MEQALIEQLVKIVGQLGWSIAIPNADGDAEVQGMIIGKEEYVDRILEHLPEDNVEPVQENLVKE